MTDSDFAHQEGRRCLICGFPGGTILQWSTTKGRGRHVRGYAHKACLETRRANTRRKRLAQQASTWEAAGQSSFPIPEADREP